MSSLVSHTAPDFTATAVLEDDRLDDAFSLSSLRGRYVALFFYPLDFTFVCPSEILAFDRRHEEFAERGCAIVGVSVDSHYTHLAWRRTSPDEGGIGPIRFPLVSDLSKQIARDFGVLTNETVALRGTFLIDPQGVVRHQVVNDLGLGRDVDELLRTLDALRHLDETGQVCPAGWKHGDPAMEASPAGVVKYLKNYRARL
jgi:peroxiredoxin (alkyl hydroperoxide reductase subunit C)